MTTSEQIRVQGKALAELGGDIIENGLKYAEPWREIINTNERFHRETGVGELLAIAESSELLAITK